MTTGNLPAQPVEFRIEVATPHDKSAKTKGDLLEKVTAELLHTQGYKVTDQVRLTASEVDLICQHPVTGKRLYVECKAHREALSAVPLHTLLGKVHFHNYDEAWLVTAGPLGRDAKGFQEEWEQKPAEERRMLHIYTPIRVIEALVRGKVIVSAPVSNAAKVVEKSELLGDWVLLLTPFGRFWAVTCLEYGAPVGVLVFSAKTGAQVDEQTVFEKLAKTDTTLSSLDFTYAIHARSTSGTLLDARRATDVVEVQQGESWADYRPARPQDFVGRANAQSRIIHLLDEVAADRISTRAFAITGDSGMGKSSLIAKLRARLQNVRYRKKHFLFAVDVRAATDASYVLLSLLTCLRRAAEAGFGTQDPEALRVSNWSDPLRSPSIMEFLESVVKKGQTVSLVFDQFEELYSKPELMGVFTRVRELLLATVSLRTGLLLGFAWKTDSTLHQEHPAYHLWHELADYRMEIPLRPFTHAEAARAMTVFERELGEKLHRPLRRQLIENSQGYPWLLKKLCIHVYELIQDGTSQSDLLDRALDVASLFDRDLQVLSTRERTCLELVAQSSPADWYEMLQHAGRDVMTSLVNKRLIVRSGDKVNLYWDIFKEYVLTKRAPSIPLTYLPASPSVGTALQVALLLDAESAISCSDLGDMANLSEKTAGNVVRDLMMFGIATGNPAAVLLDTSLAGKPPTPEEILRRLRELLKKHALTLALHELGADRPLTSLDVIDILKQINPAAQNRESTWRVYAERMCSWLVAAGYLIPTDDGWLNRDTGEPRSRIARRTRGVEVFLGDTSPGKAVEIYEHLRAAGPTCFAELKDLGYRNALAVLRQFGLVEYRRRMYALRAEEFPLSGKEAVWHAAREMPSVKAVLGFLGSNPSASGTEIGQLLGQEFRKPWSGASQKRVGNSLRQWALWIRAGEIVGKIPNPTRPRTNASEKLLMPELPFDSSK